LRFEVTAAFIIGSLIPLLATCVDYCRDGFTFSLALFRSDLPDYVAGGLLVFAGWAAVRDRSFAPVFLVLAWAYCTSMMVGSFWGQIDDTIRGETEPYNSAITVIKLALLTTSVAALMVSFRHAASAAQPRIK